MSARTAFLVRSVREANASRTHTEDTNYICTSAEALEYCRALSWTCEAFDDDVLKNKHRKLNSWGFETVFSLIQKKSGDPAAQAFLDSNLFYIQGLLIQSAKWAIVLDDYLKRHPVNEISLYDDGTGFLPIAYEAWLSGKTGVQLKRLETKLRTGSSPQGGLKGMLAHWMTNLTHYRAGKIDGSGASEKAVLVSGALNHLGEAARRIRQQGHPVIYLENQFNWSKFFFCLRERIDYGIGPSYNGSTKTFEELFPDLEIAFEGTVLTPIITAVLRAAFAKKFLRLPYEEKFMERLFRSGGIRFALLDEDQATRRALYVHARESKTPCWVISHGIPGTLLDEMQAAGLERRYPSADTFIQSELERKAYLSIYYDPQKLFMTGLPRYDEIYRLKKTELKQKSGRVKILFCGAAMAGYDFADFYPWMGLKNFYGASSVNHLAVVVRAALEHAAGVELWIKPHYHEEKAWHIAMETLGAKSLTHKIFSHRDNVFELEKKADIVISPESTVIAESLMLGKPVIALNFSGEPLMAPYGEYDLVEEARSSQEFDILFKKCLDEDWRESFTKKTKARFEYFAGACDGKNAERVLEWLLR